jgi:glycosyltransferase involved in cell wall biosynthesis
MTKISVILPTFNRAHTLERALDSVVAQTLAAQEIIVVDDGSHDGTKEKIEDWRKRSPFAGNFVYLKTGNRGVSSARNSGAQSAQGDWLAFLDSDDEWLPHKLEKQMPLVRDYPLVHGEEIWIRNGVRVNAMAKYQKSGGRIFKRCVDICCISPSSVVVNKDLFQKLGGFRADFPVCEDYELWLRIAARYSVGFVAEPVLKKYGGHEDQLSRLYKAMDFYRCRALVPFLENPLISDEERAHVTDTLIEKCEILIQGYMKRDNLADLATVQFWRSRALSAQSAVQIAHSAADRLPRSEFRGNL